MGISCVSLSLVKTRPHRNFSSPKLHIIETSRFRVSFDPVVTVFENVFPLDSRVNGSYYDMKHVEIRWKLGSDSCFQFQNNLKGADWLTHIFVHSATAMTSNKNPALSPSSSLYCGQCDTTYAIIGCILRKAFADDTILGVKREPARSAIPQRVSQTPTWLVSCVK